MDNERSPGTDCEQGRHDRGLPTIVLGRAHNHRQWRCRWRGTAGNNNCSLDVEHWPDERISRHTILTYWPLYTDDGRPQATGSKTFFMRVKYKESYFST